MSRSERWGISAAKTDAFIKGVAAHPYVCALLVCLLLNPFYLGAAENVPPNALYMESFGVLLTVLIGIYIMYKRGKIGKIQACVFGLSAAFLDYVGAKRFSQATDKGLWMLVGGIAVVSVLYACANTDKFQTQLNALFIFAIGFLVKFHYVFNTSVYTRQNDVHVFGGDSGHAAYMEYLIAHRALPNFDVREVWQFCHPPLHHIICAFWIDINENVLGVGHNPARESLQTLTLFYAMCIMITAYKLLRRFKLQNMALYVPLLMISFHPAFILMSGAINNDVLSAAFMMGAVLCTLNWYDNQTYANILKIAFCVGLGMMTKLSAAIVAPAIALVFLAVFIKKIRTDWLHLIGQFAAFGVVCVPLGLWFEIRNYIKWKVPITYVQEMPNTVMQYIGDRSFKDRLTDFSGEQFKSVFEQWLCYDDKGELTGYNEYNPIIALFKNSLFSESVNETTFENTPYMLTAARVFFWLGIALAAVFLLLMVVMLVKKCEMRPVEKTLFGFFYISMIFNYFKMCYDYPFTCTMNFRYITPTVIITSIFCGLFMNIRKNNEHPCAVKAVSAVLTLLVGAFCVLSVITYIAICAPVITE